MTCTGRCTTATDLGMPEYGDLIAYPDPDCSLHGEISDHERTPMPTQPDETPGISPRIECQDPAALIHLSNSTPLFRANQQPMLDWAQRVGINVNDVKSMRLDPANPTTVQVETYRRGPRGIVFDEKRQETITDWSTVEVAERYPVVVDETRSRYRDDNQQ